MLDRFKGFLDYDKDEFEDLWENSLVVIDTNILINFYKYTTEQSTQSLLELLKKLKVEQRLWIPHQVALEYFFNYENNMFKQQEGFKDLNKDLSNLKRDAEKKLAKVKSDHPYINTDEYKFFVDQMEDTNKQLEEKINKQIASLPDSKAIHSDLLKLLDGIIGDPYPQHQIDKIEKEGKIRYQEEIPPGFEDETDENKQGFRVYDDLKYKRVYGDLILWNQILDKASKEQSSVIFITEDRKKDWWDLDGKKIKRPHPYLVQEFFNRTHQKFYMYRTDNFVKHARSHLSIDFSEEDFREVFSEIKNIRKSEEQNYNTRLISLYYDNYYVNLLEELEELGITEIDVKRYLSKTDLDEFRMKINQVNNVKDVKDTLKLYSKAMSWGIVKAIPKLEEIAKDLTIDISSFNEDAAEGYLADIDYPSARTSEDLVSKGIHLFKLINEMEDFIELRVYPSFRE